MIKKRDFSSKKNIQQNNTKSKKKNKATQKNKYLDKVKFVFRKKRLDKKLLNEKIRRIIKKIKFPKLKTKKTQEKKVSPKEIEEKPKVNIPKQTKAYETKFDQLLFLVDKHERIAETNVMKEFHINKEIADQWGKILSENGFIDFYIPIFGDPEFRKKGVKFKRKKLSKDDKLKILIPIASIILLLIIAGAFTLFRELIFKEEVKINATEETKEPAIENVPFEGPEVEIALAFSGNGSYDCRSSDGELRYAIQNSFIKIEKLDGTSKVIIKNNRTYTLNVDTGAWKDSEVREGLSIPGSGNYPRIEMECKEINLTEKEFNT